jgi:hypothetical protein
MPDPADRLAQIEARLCNVKPEDEATGLDVEDGAWLVTELHAAREQLAKAHNGSGKESQRCERAEADLAAAQTPKEAR